MKFVKSMLPILGALAVWELILKDLAMQVFGGVLNQ